MIKQRKQKNEKNHLAEFCAPGTTYFDRMIDVSSGVSLRVVSFYPKLKRQQLPVVMAPGLISVMLTFKNILIELTKDFVVHYVETREKASSSITEKTDFDVNSIGMDMVEIVSILDLKENNYVLFGASLSATAMIHCFNEYTSSPYCMVSLEPNALFEYPPWSLIALRIAPPLYRVFKPIAKWYLKNFRVNTKDDYEMFEINCRALDAADPYKLRDVMLAINKYQIWDQLDSVESPTLIVYASKDTFHQHDDIIKMISMVKGCACCDLETHERIHSREFVDEFIKFIHTINHEKQK